MAFLGSDGREVQLHKVDVGPCRLLHPPVHGVKAAPQIDNLTLSAAALHNTTIASARHVKANIPVKTNCYIYISHLKKLVDKHFHTLDAGVVAPIDFRCLALRPFCEIPYVIILPVAEFYGAALAFCRICVGRNDSFIFCGPRLNIFHGFQLAEMTDGVRGRDGNALFTLINEP